jgi:hypothetical protein
MIHQIHISKLSEVKSVFNSPSDNEQYFKVLKNSGLNKIENVELAQPVVRQSNFSIIWKCNESGTLTNFQELSEALKRKVGADLEVFHKALKDQSLKFRNVPSDFANQIIQIPNLTSIYVNTTTWQIVLVNWGFLEDSFNRMDGLISTLFPKQSNSILVKLVDQFNEPLPNINLDFNSGHIHQSGVTNSKGYAKFNNLPKGQDFKIGVLQGEQIAHEENFNCDGRIEYVIQITQDYSEVSIIEEPKIEDVAPPFIEEVDSPEPEEEIDDFIPEDEPDPIQLKFVKRFNRPVKNLPVQLTDSSDFQFKKQTNDNGEITLFSEAAALNLNLNRHNEEWNYDLDIAQNKNHVIKLKSKFPWLWWLLLLFLFCMLLCCLTNRCYLCNLLNRDSIASNETELVEEFEERNEDEQTTKPCNSDTKSGGAGVTKTKHSLGKNNGIVTIRFNMFNVPDKLEVFYEGVLVASTFDFPGNQNGFVGEMINGKGLGSITFNYKFNKADYCMIHVTGDFDTAWEYNISCPI